MLNIKLHTRFNHWITILFVVIAMTLSGCATFTPASRYCVALTSDRPEPLWMHEVKFGEQKLSFGSFGRGGRKTICPEATSTFPDKAVLRWQKKAHYTEYPNLPMYEREVLIPKPLTKLSQKHSRYEFLFTIKEDNSVTLEVTREISSRPEIRFHSNYGP